MSVDSDSRPSVKTLIVPFDSADSHPTSSLFCSFNALCTAPNNVPMAKDLFAGGAHTRDGRVSCGLNESMIDPHLQPRRLCEGRAASRRPPGPTRRW